MIGCASDHNPVQPRLKHLLGLIQRRDAAVDRNVQVRKILFHPHDQGIVERRNITVFLGTEALQPGFASMDRDPLTASGHDAGQKFGQDDICVLIIHANATFDGYFGVHSGAHRHNTIGHEARIAHQDGTKCARLDPIRRAAAVQIDLRIARRLPQLGRLGQFRRIRAAQLQRHRMFRRIMVQQMQRPPAHQRRRGHHLCIEQRVRAQQPVQVPTMAVGPIHHRSD
mmetsp:Transcript_29497/g.57879  ORF Transcript_29497/g.57879 Transcript_29497/m.57879 type:complete len:226 (-) Transcript_29497:299-976(-)